MVIPAMVFIMPRLSLECLDINCLTTPEMTERYSGRSIEEVVRRLLRGCRGLFQCTYWVSCSGHCGVLLFCRVSTTDARRPEVTRIPDAFEY
jgi:hypothetical protein